MIFGAVYQFEGQLGVFTPHLGGPCYQCLFPNQPDDPQAPIGVFGALPGVIGSLQAVECIKLLASVGKAPTGALLVYDALNTAVTRIEVPVNPNCPVCAGRGVL